MVSSETTASHVMFEKCGQLRLFVLRIQISQCKHGVCQQNVCETELKIVFRHHGYLQHQESTYRNSIQALTEDNCK